MFHSLSKFLSVIILLHFFSLVSVIAGETKQTEFGGVKLGTRADALGFVLDEEYATYKFKKKFRLYGTFNKKGHPINEISLRCSEAEKGDNVGGISCDNKADDIKSKFGTSISEKCEKDEPMEWKDFTTVNILYNASTNQYWWIDSESGKIESIGITSGFEGFKYNCLRQFSLEEIDSLRLYQNAKLVLKENFSGNLGWTYLNHNTQIRFDPEDPNFPIKEIEFKCDIKEYPSRSKLFGFGCMDNFDNITNKTSANAKIYCDHPFNGKQALKLVYMEDSHAFWEFDSTNIVYKFGYLERVDQRWMQCLDSKQLTDLQLMNEKKNVNPEELWTKVFDSGSLIVYLDTKNIVRVGNENRFWTFYSYKKRRCMAYCDATMHDPEYVDSGKFYIGMNCSELLYRSMGYRYFYIEDGIRRTYDSGNGVGDWRSIIDDVDLLLKDKICH